MKTGCWSGVQPPSTHLRPAAQVPPAPHGSTQCCSTHTVPVPLSPPAPHWVELVHVVVEPSQTPFAVSHAYPVGQAVVAEQVGVHAPCTHCDSPAHWVASAHWSVGATHWPVRQRAPAVDEQSLSLEHADVAPPSPPIAMQAGVPFEPLWSAQTKPDEQPAVEQSPAWHWLSAPQTVPVAQSAGFAHVPAGVVVAGVPLVNLQTLSLLHV